MKLAGNVAERGFLRGDELLREVATLFGELGEPRKDPPVSADEIQTGENDGNQRSAEKEIELALHAVGQARLETEAVGVAVAVGKKLAATLIEREPLAEITALAMDCFRHLVSAPHVVVRVSDAQHESVAKRIEETARARGLASNLVVLAEPDIRLGDCRIEWADGGVNRDRGVTEAAIEEAVARYVKARLTDTPDTSRRTDR